MSYLVRAVGVEVAKTRRTLALWLTIVAPAAIALLQFAMLMQNPSRRADPSGGEWESTMRSVMVLWSLLMLPLFVTLETALTASIDHNSRAWKWLFALPLPRWSYYTAKLLLNTGLIALSTTVMALISPLVGLGLRTFHPGSGYEGPIPWVLIAESAALVFVAGLLIIAIHTYVSMRWSSFVVASAFGTVATVAAIMLVSSKYVDEYPWTLSGYTVMNLAEAGIAWRVLALSAAGAFLVWLGGCWDFCRQDAA